MDNTTKLTPENFEILQNSLTNLAQANANQAIMVANLQAVITAKDKKIKELEEK